MCLGSPACRSQQIVFCNVIWLLAGQATNSVWISDLGYRYFYFPTARCRDTNPHHLLYAGYRQLFPGSKLPMLEANQVNHLLLILRINGVRHTFPHATSFLPAVILKSTNYVYALSEREWERNLYVEV